MTIRVPLGVPLAVCFLLAQCLQAASQLATFYDAVAKDPSYVGDSIDLSKVVTAEEIPTLAKVLASGNRDLMLRAISGATGLLQVHVNDGLPNFHQLRPPLAEVKDEFQALVPILTDHFDEADPRTSNMTANGTTDYTDILWKTRVVQFMDVLGATLSPNMLAWMLKVAQWPDNDGGRSENGMAITDRDRKTLETGGGPKYTERDHDAGLATTIREERSDAEKIIPALAHLNPMPPAALSVLNGIIDNNNEPHLSSLAIFHLSQNKSIDRQELANRLVTKALDTNTPVGIRAAAIHGIGFLDVPSAKSKAIGLDRDPNDKIAGAAIDIGVNFLEMAN